MADKEGAMSMALLGPYTRSICVVGLSIAALVFALTNTRLVVYEALLPAFEWMETTPFGVVGKTWGAAFAVVEAVHLLAMAVLGGAVIVGDGRLLGLVLKDLPLKQVQDQAHNIFVVALLVAIFTGVFLACGVAVKIYYLEVFWYKMLALATGVIFVFAIRRPMLRAQEQVLTPGLLRLLGISSLMIWFSVAATGRWIGFSG